LRIGNAIQINIAELQNYAKLNRTPCVIFVPAQASVDPANANRHQQFVNSLHSKGTVSR